MNLDKIPKAGTTIGRKRFWDKARDIVLSLQKKEGRNVSVDERQGAGTVINVIRERGGSPTPPTGACCVGEDCSITTESECEEMEGVYQGDDTTCDPNPCECCPDGPTHVSGSVTFSYSGTDGVSGDRVISGSGTFSEDLPFPFGGGSFTGTDCCDDDCLDLSEGFVNLEISVSCDPETGWSIHLFVGLPNWCGFQTSFLKNYIYAGCGPGTGSFEADLDVDGGSGFGTGSCHIEFVLS